MSTSNTQRHKLESSDEDHLVQSKRRKVGDGGGKKVVNHHSKGEQKGRQKINDKISELKELLPECQSGAANKAAVLRSAADQIRKYQYVCYQLFMSNMKIGDENNKVREEINRLRGLVGINPSMDTMDGAGGLSTRNDAPLNIKPEIVDPLRFINSNMYTRQDPMSLYMVNSCDVSRFRSGTLPADSGIFSPGDSSASDKDSLSSPEDDTYSTWR